MNIRIKKIALALCCFFMTSAAFSQKLLRYFSPNNDGIRDVLTIPFSVKDDSRIVSWKLVVENSKGKTVKTIGNKISLPSKISASQMFKQIGKAKEDVIIPEYVIWDGTLDDGTIAPDGDYYYYISAKDENENVSKSKKYVITLDNTLPSAKLKMPLDDELIFGEGNKSVLKINQTGSSELKWIGKVSDLTGKVVKTLTWENSVPKSFEWDGTDDNKMIVPDGIYNYSLVGEDKAGNLSEEYTIKNIIFSAEKPATNIAISGHRYFSIEKQSSKNTITFDVTIPLPKNTNANKLTHWTVNVLTMDKKIVRTYDSSNFNKPNESDFKIVFDAKDNNSKEIPEGRYYASVSAKYLNGYESHPISTVSFLFDKTSPECKVTAQDNIFSPDGDSKKDTIVFKVESDRKDGSPIEFWKGQIVNTLSKDSIVKEFDFGQACPSMVEWDGLNNEGKLSEDGNYEFIVTGKDLAGNTVVSKVNKPFRLDTSKTEVVLSVNQLNFSPNNDGVKDFITFSTSAKKASEIVRYSFEIINNSGKVCYVKKENSLLPEKINWNGTDNLNKVLLDGKYSAVLTIESSNGSSAKSEVKNIVIDTEKPFAKLDAKYLIFSPDGDKNKDIFTVDAQECTVEKAWNILFLDKNKKIVFDYKINNSLLNDKDFKIVWFGTDKSGKKLPDGKYSLLVSSTDDAGNKFEKSIENIILDSRVVKAYLTCSYEGISPLSTTGLTQQKFGLRTSVTDGIKSWRFDVKDQEDKVVYSVLPGEDKTLPKEIYWDGKNSDGKNLEGKFYGQLTMEYEKGNKVLEKSSVFVSSSIPPKLNVETNPRYFSPDDDGIDDDLYIKLNALSSGKISNWSFIIYNPEESGKKGKVFWKTSGATKITDQLVWNGLSNVSKESNGQAERVQSAMDYPWEFTVTDSLGMTSTVSGKISIDILVTRDGNVLKIAVPAIIFRANHADFKTAKEAKGSKVTEQQAKNNERVLKRVAQILEKFPDYSVTVVGHANNISGTEAEETSTKNGNIPLIPLSQDRAEFVKTRLVNYGIDASRLKTEGKGGRERIAALKDRENWWKNRRVEFILHK